MHNLPTHHTRLSGTPLRPLLSVVTLMMTSYAHDAPAEGTGACPQGFDMAVASETAVHTGTLNAPCPPEPAQERPPPGQEELRADPFDASVPDDAWKLRHAPTVLDRMCSNLLSGMHQSPHVTANHLS